MKTKKVSRVLALLLSLLLLLGTLPAALAETSTVVTDEEYEKLLDAAVVKFYEDLLFCENHDDFVALVASLTEEQYRAVCATLTEEQIAALDAHDWELFLKLIGNPAKNVTDAGPLVMPPVFIPEAAVMLLAANDESESAGSSDGSATTTEGLMLSKKAESVEGGYQITLEAYTTGEVKETSTVVPCDIILVLDESGSMDYYIGKTPIYDSSLDTSENYYMVDSNGASRELQYHNGQWGYYSGFGNRKEWNPVTSKTSADDTTKGRVQFFVSTEKRQAAITTAVNSFLADVRTDNGNIAEGTTGHRVGIVGFSGDGDARTIRDLGTNLTDIGTNTLRTEGGTYIDDGLQIAVNMFKNADTVSGKRNRVVIVFTDGNPGTGNWNANDSKKCAVDAVNLAKTLKTATTSGGYGATVYAVGIFDGANPSDTTGESNRFMNAVSSNYPEATATYSKGEYRITLNSWIDSGDYYLSASNSEALDDIFQSLGGVIGAPTINVTSSATIKDIIAPSFVLPEGATVTLQTADRTADGGWTNVVTNPTGVTYSVTTVNGVQTLSVTGFDYAKNYVADTGRDEADPSKSGSFYGRKLVITFTIQTKPDFLGGNNVTTNGATSGFYATAGDGTAIKYFDVPNVNVKVETLTPVIIDENIYLGNQAVLTGLISGNGNAYKIGDKIYPVDGVNNAYVDIEYTFTDAENNPIATYKIPAGTKSGTLTVVNNDKLLLAEDATYTITCVVTPTNEGVYTATTGENQGTVNVYKPVVTFQDSAEEYLATMTETDVTGYYTANNYVSEVWKHGNTLSTDKGVGMTGTKPEIELTYTAATDWLDGNMKVIGTADVGVEVTATITSKDNPDVSNTFTVTSIRKKCECAGVTCDHQEDTEAANMGNEPEFVVHITGVAGNLKIVKTGLEQGESAIFTVRATRANGTEPETWKIVLTGDGSTDGVSETITGLKAQSDYIVTEDAWSWSYTVTEPENKTGEIDAGDTVEVTYSNSKKDQWLTDESAAVNTYEDLKTSGTTN